MRTFDEPFGSIQALVLATAILASAASPLRAADAPPPSRPVPAPAAGDVIPSFDAETIGEGTKTVSFPKGSKTVLLFFLSGCPICHRMIPEWNRAYKDKPAGVEVYGILMDKEPPGFFVVTPIEFPVLRSPGREFQVEIKVQRVPTMMRVGSGGRVEDVAMGEVDRMRLSQIFKP